MNIGQCVSLNVTKTNRTDKLLSDQVDAIGWKSSSILLDMPDLTGLDIFRYIELCSVSSRSNGNQQRKREGERELSMSVIILIEYELHILALESISLAKLMEQTLFRVCSIDAFTEVLPLSKLELRSSLFLLFPVETFAI